MDSLYPSIRLRNVIFVAVILLLNINFGTSVNDIHTNLSNDEKLQLCLESFPFITNHPDCLTILFIKLIGIAIIVGACLSKAPFILNIINSKSSIGLSRPSLYGEVIMCANGALYGLLQGFPFTSYGESIGLTIQSLIVVVLVWKYTVQPTVSKQEQIIAITSFGLYSIGACLVLPAQYQYVLVSLNWPVLVYSRGIQILETCRIQHTGAQSIVTNGLNLGGGLVRIVTTLHEIGWDFAVLTGFVISTILNAILIGQQLYYKDNTTKFLLSLQNDDENTSTIDEKKKNTFVFICTPSNTRCLSYLKLSTNKI